MSITLSIIYLISTVTFVIGLKLLGHPETAKKGNLIAATGMGLAIIGTIVLHDLEVSNLVYILIALAILVILDQYRLRCLFHLNFNSNHLWPK